MSKSKYEYVKNFEVQSKCIPETFILVRIDGKGFSKFTTINGFAKPNDRKALDLMNIAANEVCKKFKDIFLAYGQSDEFSFMLGRDTDLYNRRKEKICSTLVSVFTAVYNIKFEEIMGKKAIGYAIFDGRVVEYPSLKSMKDYFSWRQVDCHINNLYNTCFWKFVLEEGLSHKKTEKILKDTVSSDKHELLFSKFKLNYSHEPAIFRKGSLLIRHWKSDPAKLEKYNQLKKEGKIKNLSKPREKLNWNLEHCDLIQNKFWNQYFPDIN